MQYLCTYTCTRTRMHYVAIQVNQPSGISQAAAIAVHCPQGVKGRKVCLCRRVMTGFGKVTGNKGTRFLSCGKDQASNFYSYRRINFIFNMYIFKNNF